MGSLSGVFIITKERLEAIKGKRIYFGEVLGKHSDIVSDGCYENCEVSSIEEDKIRFVKKFFGYIEKDGLTLSGVNPVVEYFDQEGDYDEDDE